ncbi:MAG: CHC2 zinc finger domain-containing protein [Actinomycetota bacterium]|nr:CHC2 zinc finger domain-containing protein [Actinomycetota bacterium]
MSQSSWANETASYLGALFESGRADLLIEVRCPRYPRLRSFFHTWGIDSAAGYISRHADKADIYVGVAPRIRKEGKQTGGKDAIDQVQALWADCDTSDAITMLADFVPAPTIEVASGGGVHAYWMLDAPVSKEQAEIGNRRLALALSADRAATDAARVLRPPGTFNHKPERMIDGEPAPVTLRALTDARYTWDEVVGALPDPIAPQRRSIPARAVRRGEDPLFTIEPPVYVELLSGRTVGADNKAICPFHADVTPSLHAYPDPEDGWWCFGCKRGGRHHHLRLTALRDRPAWQQLPPAAPRDRCVPS